MHLGPGCGLRWSGGPLFYAPSTSLSGHLPHQVAQKRPRNLQRGWGRQRGPRARQIWLVEKGAQEGPFPCLGWALGHSLHFVFFSPGHSSAGLASPPSTKQARGLGAPIRWVGKGVSFACTLLGGEERIWRDGEPALIGPEPCPVQEPGQAAPSHGTCYFQES